jgi:hypothetical protein
MILPALYLRVAAHDRVRPITKTAVGDGIVDPGGEEERTCPLRLPT